MSQKLRGLRARLLIFKNEELISRQFIFIATISVVTFILYCIGFRILFLPVIVAINAWRLPLPKIFNSWFGRTVAALLLAMGLIQLAASLQFLIMPGSSFKVLGIFLLLLVLVIWLLAPKQRSEKIKVISKRDICAVLIIACFVFPFSPILLGSQPIIRIGQIGSTQAIDATNHFFTISQLTYYQHFGYSVGHYVYPLGFHIADAFLQNSFISNQYKLGFNGNVLLYFFDYLFYGSLMIYVLYFLCISWANIVNDKLKKPFSFGPELLAAACLVLPLLILYVIPFISEGFLSYYYVCITLITGLIFLTELKDSVKTAESSLNLSSDNNGRWWLLAYLILLYGASATWPLLTPPFAFVGIMFLLPKGLSVADFIKRVLNLKGIAVILLFATQLLPVYFQYKYGFLSTATSIDYPGTLTQFHPYVLLLGAVVILALIAVNKIDEGFKRLLFNVFMPLAVFITGLMLFQLFTTGQVVYYVIKVSLLIEMIMLALEVGVLVSSFRNSRLYEARNAWLLPIVPIIVILLLISSIDNPLKDIRDVFRVRSNDVIPQYLSEDVQTEVKLGQQGKLHHFNMTVLHYNPDQGKFFADMQVPFWADMMQVSTANLKDIKATSCINTIYKNLGFGSYDAAAQMALTTELENCANFARSRKETFYVITDPASAPHVRNLLGNLVTIVLD